MYPPDSPPRSYSPSRTVGDDGRDDFRDDRRDQWRRDDRDRDWDRERSPRRTDSRRYDDDRVPPPRRYDDDRVPPPRRHDDYERERVLPPRRYDDRHDEGHGRYRDRDHDHRRDRDRHDERDRDGPSPPSRDIIFLGLDSQLTENDLAGFLRTEFGATLESTKIVREKNGQPKGFGFATFTTLQQAERFVYDNYPIVTMPALFAHSSAKRVKIDFAGSRADNGAGGGGGVIRHPPPVRGHDGTRDIGQPDGTQRVLLLRGLDPGTYSGEVTRRFAEEIARMLGKSVREAEGTITRVVMIVDRATDALWSFAFIELVTPELASALLPFLLSPQNQPNGFLISQVPIAASFANPAAFVPTPAGPLGGQFLLRAVSNGGIGAATIDSPDGEWCSYWHQAAGAVETIPRAAPPIPAKGAPLVLSDETKAFLGRLAGAQAPQPPPGFAPPGSAPGLSAAVPADAASAAALPPSALPTSIQPIKIGINLGGGAGIKKKPPPKVEDGIIPISHKNVLGGDDDDGDPGKDSVLLSRTKGAKIIPPTSTSRKIAKNINKWNTKQTELAKPAPAKEPRAPARVASSVNAIPVGGGTASGPPAIAASSAPDAPQEEFDYTDLSTFATTGKGACLLCQRQFKAEETLRRHVASSELHKTNLADPIIREAGRQRKEAATGPKYRDRAAERRGVFNQPEKPKLPDPYRKYKQNQAGGAGGSGASQPSQPPPPPQPSAPAADDLNVGNKLLAKMGWTAGSGLGASSDGRVDPIQVQQFDERVGLGAAKGREAGKWSGPGGWNERKKDMTKERYEAANK